jgi:hypothetical protein
MVWKGLFQHLEGSPMDDYHEFKRAHEIQIEKWWLYWFPNYVFVTTRIVAPSGVTTIPITSSTSGSENATSSGAIKSGGTTGGGSVGDSTNAWGPWPIFNPIVEFFRELRWNYQGVKIEKLWSLQDFHYKPHESS